MRVIRLLATTLVVAIASTRLARAQGKDLDGVVNLNTADAPLLQLLPGIGPAKVRSIVWYRQKHPFRTVDELVRIKGIGRKMVRRLRVHLAVNGPTTAHVAHHPRDADPPADQPRADRLRVVVAPPARRSIEPAPLPKRPTGMGTVSAIPGRARPRSSPASDRGRPSLANHCPRPP